MNSAHPTLLVEISTQHRRPISLENITHQPTKEENNNKSFPLKRGTRTAVTDQGKVEMFVMQQQFTINPIIHQTTDHEVSIVLETLENGINDPEELDPVIIENDKDME